MTRSHEEVRIASFASVFGDIECSPADLPGFDEVSRSIAPAGGLDAMGCGTIRKMSSSLDDYVVECIAATVKAHGVSPADVGHVVFSTADATLGLLGPDFVARIMAAAGLVRCVPVLVSHQQCCSSLAALTYGWNLFSDDEVDNVVVVSFAFTPDDGDRVRPFAVFGDAVASCMISRHCSGGAGFRLLASTVDVDYDGLLGRDSITSRQGTARASLSKLFRGADATVAEVARVFPSNLYTPVTLFNAAMVGLDKAKLHFEATSRSYGHCAGSDWMINLIDYAASGGIETGASYLALSSAPGLFASTLLRAAP